MKKNVLLFLFALSLASVYAQTEDSVQAPRPSFIFSGEIGGTTVLSLGLEKLFFLKSRVVLAGKVAFGFNQKFELFSSEDPTNYFILPHSFTVNMGGGKRSMLELGIGGSWITNNSENYYLVYPMLGYRLHPFKNPGFSFKAWAMYPFGQSSTMETTNIWILPLGLSFGIAL